MSLSHLPREIWTEIFKGFVASDLIALWHNFPSLRGAITPDRLKIASNNAKVKENYDFPDEFYLIEENVKQREAELFSRTFYISSGFVGFFLSYFQSFKGALLIEHYEGLSYIWREYFSSTLLRDVPIEVILHHDKCDFNLEWKLYNCSLGHAGRLKSITLPDLEEINSILLDRFIKMPRGLLQFPNVTKLNFDGFYALDVNLIDTINKACPQFSEFDFKAPPKKGYISILSLEDIFKHFTNPNLLSSKQSFALKKMSITNLVYYRFKIEELHLPNLEVLEINRCAIDSIKNLNMPTLSTLTINKSSLREISDLKLDSLVTFTINLSLYHPSERLNGGQIGSLERRTIRIDDKVYIDGDFWFRVRKVDAPNLERFSVDKNNELSIKIYDIKLSAGNIKTFGRPQNSNFNTLKKLLGIVIGVVILLLLLLYYYNLTV